MTRVNDALRAELAALWPDLQLTTEQIGARLGISAPRVSQLVTKMGLSHRSPAGRRALTDAQLATLESEIRARHAVLEPQRAVAKALRISNRRVIAIEKRLGLTRPRAGVRNRGLTKYIGEVQR